MRRENDFGTQITRNSIGAFELELELEPKKTNQVDA